MQGMLGLYGWHLKKKPEDADKTRVIRINTSPRVQKPMPSCFLSLSHAWCRHYAQSPLPHPFPPHCWCQAPRQGPAWWGGWRWCSWDMTSPPSLHTQLALTQSARLVINGELFPPLFIPPHAMNPSPLQASLLSVNKRFLLISPSTPPLPTANNLYHQGSHIWVVSPTQHENHDSIIWYFTLLPQSPPPTLFQLSCL